jgi:hypothetical protein
VDYGFAPGGTDQDVRARILFTLRSNTKLISDKKKYVAVRDFTQHLKSGAAIARPVDDVLIGSHATSKGVMLIALFRGQKGPTDYETLVESLATANRSIAIDDAVFGYAPGDPISHTVHFRGCNLGKALPFLTKLKEAFGGRVRLAAPIHFHGMFHLKGYGLWEYMSYEFVLPNKTDFPDRAALVQAFKGGNFKLIDGSDVPAAQWDKWVPEKISETNSVLTIPPLGMTIGERKTIDAVIELRVNRKPYTHSPIEFPTPADVPTTDAAQFTWLQTVLGVDNLFQEPGDTSPHPFPMYERMGYSTRAKFLDGYRWMGNINKKNLTMVGSRVEYTLVVPILKPNGDLFFNFHPDSVAHQQHLQLFESDTRFFESV